MTRSRLTGWLAGALLISTLTLGCSLYRNDHCFVPDEKYSQARDLYIRTGSLELVERTLVDLQWQSCMVRETVYRLQKEFEVLPEETPAR